MAFRMTMRTSVPGLRRVAAHLGVDEQGDVQKMVTGEIFERIKKYMPRESGELISKTRITRPTIIEVDSPYAKRQFFGIREDGSHYRYDTSSNPNAGPHWDARMMAAEGNSLRAKVQRYVKRLG